MGSIWTILLVLGAIILGLVVIGAVIYFIAGIIQLLFC